MSRLHLGPERPSGTRGSGLGKLSGRAIQAGGSIGQDRVSGGDHHTLIVDRDVPTWLGYETMAAPEIPVPPLLILICQYVLTGNALKCFRHRPEVAKCDRQLHLLNKGADLPAVVVAKHHMS